MRGIIRITLLKKLKLQINSHAKLGSLSIAQMQMVEIAKAVSANCKVLILDEPTSSLTANEVESLFRIMRELKEQGVALVYISHKMDEIKVIADEVTIMREGHYIGKWDVANMTKEQIIAKMVGRELSNLFPPLENHPSEEVMMKVEDFTSIHPRSFRHCSFELKKGEILGVAGLVGAQRTELMEGIFVSVRQRPTTSSVTGYSHVRDTGASQFLSFTAISVVMFQSTRASFHFSFRRLTVICRQTMVSHHLQL